MRFLAYLSFCTSGTISVGSSSFRDEVGLSKNVAHLLPDDLTQAGFWFILQAHRLTSTFHSYQWMTKFVTSSEWMLEDYAEYLEIEEAPFEAEEDQLSFYQLVYLQMVWADELHFSRLADTLISYLTDLVACAYKHQPALIPSKAKFDLDHVRKFRTINDAVRTSAMAELERISRSGFNEILAEAKRLVSCDLTPKTEQRLREAIRLRNDIVHKQGRYPEIIHSMFKKRERSRSLVRHKPADTARLEVTACEVVGQFEGAATKLGFEIVARKSEIFEQSST